MSCERYANAIADHACGAEISGDAAAHLEICGSCRQLLEAQRRSMADLDRELALALEIEPSAEFVPDVMARVRRRRTDWRAVAWWGVPIAAAAALALAVLASLQAGVRPIVAPTRSADASASAKPPSPPTIEARPGSTETKATSTEAKPPSIEAKPPSLEAKPPSSATRPSAVDRVHVNQQRPVGNPAAVAAQAQHVEPEVLVPAESARAMARYLGLVRKGAIDTSTLAEPKTSGNTTPTDLVIQPLAVDAIAMTEVEDRIGPGAAERDAGVR